MNKFKIRLTYTINCYPLTGLEVEVEAKDSFSAIEKAILHSGRLTGEIIEIMCIQADFIKI